MSNKRYGLIGEKLSHSYSPEIHKRLSGIDYKLYEISSDEIESFIRAEDIGGLNVTIPYKQAVIPFCDYLSPVARLTGSVNTLVYRQGKIYGYNTDYSGFEDMLCDANISLKKRNVMVLGDGGASKTVQAVCEANGARQCIVVSRRGPITYDKIYGFSDCEIIINTTPVGMYPDCPERIVNLSMFGNLYAVADLIYNPHRTELIMQAQELSLLCAGGLSMLVMQAKSAAQLFFGKPFSQAEVKAIQRDLYKKTANIILIGMPGSGKSTVGEMVSKTLGIPFADIDKCIEKEVGMSIPQIFKQYGEREFRRLEAAQTDKYGKSNGCVIATGGGVVLDKANYPRLHQNGRIYYLRRNIERLQTVGRPLSVDMHAIKEIYVRRAALYDMFADAVIDNNDLPQIAVNKILEDFNEISCD